MEKKSKKPTKLKIQNPIKKLTEENIGSVFEENFSKVNLLIDHPNYNNFLNEKELLNSKLILKDDTFKNLYPSLDDPNFNIRIAEKKEFNDNKYDGTIYEIEEQS